MGRAIGAGSLYFALVFAAGFVFGTLRALLGAEGAEARLVAVALELPVILVVAWFACAFAIRRFTVAPRFGARALMGVGAFALLMGGEVAISVGLLGRTLGEHLAIYREFSHALGLAGQMVFAMFPVARLWLRQGG